MMLPLGLISYSIFNYYKWGNFIYFIQSQGELANSRAIDTIILFPQTVIRYVKIISSIPIYQYEWWIALLEITTFLFIGSLIYVGWRQKIRFSYLIFMILGFLIPVLSGTFSGLPRYVIVLFPIFIALALIKNKLFKWSYMLISPILLFILLMFFSRGYFIA